MVQLHNVFPSIQAVREAIQQFVLSEGELYKTKKSDKTKYVIVCKDNDCNFRI
jgi:hypothetical protein